MKVRAQEWGIPFPYLRDESQEVARKYDARCTPDIYVFAKQKGKVLAKRGSYVYGRDRKLVYRGRINDNWQEPEKVTCHDLADAIEAVLGGTKQKEPQFPSMGCSIKWKA